MMAGVVNQCRWCDANCYDMDPCSCESSKRFGPRYKGERILPQGGSGTISPERLTCPNPNCGTVNVFVACAEYRCPSCRHILYINTTLKERS